MFEQILIRFRGGPLLGNDNDGADSSLSPSSESTTSLNTTGAAEGRGKETLQLPLSRSMAYKLSPSPSLGRSPSPSEAPSIDSSSSSSSTSDQPFPSNYASGSSRMGRKHVITPKNSSDALKAFEDYSVRCCYRNSVRQRDCFFTRSPRPSFRKEQETESC